MRLQTTLAAMILWSMGSVALAQVPNMSGYWAPEFGVQKVPTARLVAAITDKVLAGQADQDAYAIRWCNAIGMPALMNDTLDIRQADRLMVISSEAYSYPRYVYFDLPPRDFEILDPTSAGYSDAHWEGDTLVVETGGFAGYDYEQEGQQEVRGITAIPGGGFRTPGSRLVERFRLTNGGSELVVESTWTDPKVFQNPHTYAYRYQRLAPTYEPPMPTYCDPFDPERTAFLGADEKK